MASLMEELLDVLGKEEKQYQELITLATEKTDAVVQGNIEHLSECKTTNTAETINCYSYCHFSFLLKY